MLFEWSHPHILKNCLLYICYIWLVSTPNCLSAKDCHFAIRQEKANITSPGFPVSYPPNSDCTWLIEVPKGKMIILKTIDFQLEQSYKCASDSLSIYDGPSSVSPLFERLYCDQNGPLALTSSSNTMFLHFKSDNILERKGFKLTYEAVPECNYKYFATNGTFSSPLYPRNYYPNANCSYYIETTPGYNLKLTFKDFELEPIMAGANECYDYILVYEMLPTGQFQLKKTCGTSSPGIIRTKSNRMLLRFVSDSSVDRRGFDAVFTSEYYTCQHNEFRCGSGICISVDALCDRSDDCGDNSDEAACSCKDDEFTCRNGKCLDTVWTCDDEDDCGDNSDEFGCATTGTPLTNSSIIPHSHSSAPPSSTPTWTPHASCNRGQFHCKNSRCISSSLSCNNVDNCGDNSDENGCHGSCSVNNGGCSQICNFDRFFGAVCSCNSGYQLAQDSKSCEDIDECRQTPCSFICINTPGSYKCACRNGYTLDATGKGCVDRDECSVANGNCPQTCVNSIGSFQCGCFSGYTYDKQTGQCNDVNECSVGNGGCKETCVNFPGSYRCECKRPGYEPRTNDSVCQDIDECVTGRHDCQHLCQNTDGSYTCSCHPGFLKSHADDKKCVDIDECMEGSPGCFGRCINTVGSFYCMCDKGLRGIQNNTKCEDIDECKANNGGCQHTCINTMGNYDCKCNQGYRKKSGDPLQCEDINECRGAVRRCEHICINSPGSFRCSCISGFSLNNQTQCVDIDECALFPPTHGCDQICTNIPRSYKCSCRRGYILDSDGKACRDAAHVTACGSANAVMTRDKNDGWRGAINGVWPWQVYFKVNLGVVKLEKYGCMGTLINRNYVITAAHCVFFGRWRVPPGKFYIHLGATQKRDGSEVVTRAKRIVIHHDYKKSGDGNDVAMIELENPAPLSARVRPICLPEKENKINLSEKSLAASITWGRISKSQSSLNLRQRNLRVAAQASCSWSDGPGMKGASDYICLVFNAPKDSSKVCLSDSGSPLMVKSPRPGHQGSTTTAWYLAGLQIYGAGIPNIKPCSRRYRYLSFHDINTLLVWIGNTTRSTS